MKKIVILSLCAAFILNLPPLCNPLMAAKPLPVIGLSNGYPSGPHENLNIHGKSYFTCDSTEGGNSVFISEYGDSTVSYVTNRKSTVTELTVIDKCAEAFDGDPATVQLPYESEGFYVFAAVHAKPNNGSNGDKSSVILSPNLVRQACNDTTETTNPDFPTYTECPDDNLLALGLIVGDNVYEATDVGLVRFIDEDAKGNGKSTGTDITDLFKWTGWVYDASLDLNGDGVIDIYDVPMTYDLSNGDELPDGIIDEVEFDNWLNDQIAEGLATYYEDEWILNIADLVVSDQNIDNDGVKLLKLRFYPVATTIYE